MRPGLRAMVGVVSVTMWSVAACGGSSDGSTSTDTSTDTSNDETIELPSLAEVADVELEDHRADLLATLGPPQAFRISFVTIDGVDIRHDTWDYLELESRIDLIDGQIVLTADLEPVPDGTWYPVHVDPSDFEAGMSPDDVTARLVGVELQELDLSEVTDAGGTALVGGQLLVTFSDGVIVSAESFPLVPDPDGLQADLIEAVSP